MKHILLILLFAAIFSLEGEAQNVQAKKNEKAQIEKEIKFINNQLKGLTKQQKATTRHLSLIQKKASDRRSILESLDDQLTELDSQIKGKEGNIRAMQAELDTLTAYYQKLIYNCYKNRDPKVWFMYVLGSEDIGQGYRRMRYLKVLSDAVNKQGEKIGKISQKLSGEKAKLQESCQEATKLKSQRKKEYDSLLAEEKESKEIISQISRDKKKYQAELTKKRKEVQNLNKEIQRILNSAVKAANKTKLKPEDAALSGEFSQNRGKLGWPVESGIISEHFGVHNHPVYKNIKLPECNGITIVTTKNAKVKCVFRGEVKRVIVMPGYNHCVLVQHGEYYTFYCKLNNVSVKAGQKVVVGSQLGTLEADGNGSSLHFQIWEGTSKQNPESWLR